MGICMKSNNIATPTSKEQQKLIKSATSSQEDKNKLDNSIEEEVVHSQLKQSEIKSSQLMVPDQSNYSQSAEIKKVPTEKSFILASEQGDDHSPTQEISELKENNQKQSNLEAQWSEMQKKLLIEGGDNNNNFECSEPYNNFQDLDCKESFNDKLIKEQEEEDD